MSGVGQGSSSISQESGSVDLVSGVFSDNNEPSTSSPGPSHPLVTTPPRSQGSPTVAELTSSRSPNVLLGKTRKSQRLDNFFSGKAHAAYSLSPQLDSSLLSMVDDSPDDGQRCARGCTEILDRLLDVFTIIGRHNAKTEQIYKKSYPCKQHVNVTGKLSICMQTLLCYSLLRSHVSVFIEVAMLNLPCIY